MDPQSQSAGTTMDRKGYANVPQENTTGAANGDDDVQAILNMANASAVKGAGANEDDFASPADEEEDEVEQKSAETEAGEPVKEIIKTSTWH